MSRPARSRFGAERIFKGTANKLTKQMDQDKLSKIVSMTNDFMAPSQAIADSMGLIDKGDNAMGLLGFSCGVLAAFSARSAMQNADFESLLRLYFARTVGNNPVRINEYIGLLKGIAESKEWSHSIDAGKDAANEFLSDGGYKPASFNRLMQMLN